ncbi:tetratricopeptide repeat protein [Pseudomonas sp. MT3]|uniref:tetratricopeptide repeat protein n=1 Tax=Pseudomonas sp. ATCC 13867 TaxID=1294143 RepID=UPI0002C4E8ED|nr:tetratricopeptide repeat protein [Pseudomonas sp. ATCC 13867]AGI23654.1 hypothetical protein H681_08900 [Pseudomonas sp. ATCC 13867]RFQ41591.1 tetratricopeptide repeat protein [Pseudomonas sp. ATCC 13867]
MKATWILLLATPALLAGCAGRQADPNFAYCTATSQAHKDGDYARAVEQADLCQQKNTLSPRGLSALYSIQADAYEQLKRYPEAIATQEKSIKVDPHTYGRDVLTLSRYYRVAGNPQKALELVESNLDKGLGEAGVGAGFHMPTYYHQGLALLDLGRNREAAEALSAGLMKQPDYAWAHYYRGVAYDRLGQRSDARSDFQAFAKSVDKQYVEPEHKQQLEQYQISL